MFKLASLVFAVVITTSCGVLLMHGHGPTPLLQAAADGDLAGVNAALDAGADIDGHAMDDWTALTIASRKGHTDVVALLLDRGAEVNEREGGGHTARYWAEKYGHQTVADLLRARGGVSE